MQTRTITVSSDDNNKRLDMFVSDLEPNVTRSRIKNLIESGEILVNGEKKKAGYSLKINDEVSVNISAPTELSLEPSDIPLDIIYEDEYLAVVNKPQGMVTHPATGSPNGTLVNALLYQLNSLSSINGVIRPGIVHRLDKDTSGLLVVAKTDEAHVDLQKQIQSKECKRNYIALVDGIIVKDDGVIITNIDRSKKDRKLMTVVKIGGRVAETHYKVLERFAKYTLVEYELKTGRTHQIRVHSRYMNHPVVGDSVYGGSIKLYNNGQLLHAFKLSFSHPITKEFMQFEAELPEYFKSVLEKLRSK